MRFAARWFVPLGFVTGLLWIGVFRFTWRLYGEVGSVRPIPALAVTLLECVLTGPFLAMGLARTVHLLTEESPTSPESSHAHLTAHSDEDELVADASFTRAVTIRNSQFAIRNSPPEPPRTAPLSPVGTLVLGLTILTEWVFLFSIPVVGSYSWPVRAGGWLRYLNALFPQPIYRPLLLAPVWGRWGILLAATIGRTRRGADSAVVALCSAMTPARLLRHALIPIILTSIYCSRSRNYLMGPIVGLIVFGVTYLVAVIMAWRGGGQTRQSVFAAGQIAQLVFLAVHRALWPWIHG